MRKSLVFMIAIGAFAIGLGIGLLRCGFVDQTVLSSRLRTDNQANAGKDARVLFPWPLVFELYQDSGNRSARWLQ